MKRRPCNEGNQQFQTLCNHTFSDLSRVSPVVFLYLLMKCYMSGTKNGTPKFRALQQNVRRALNNDPQPGPARFVVHCLCILYLFGPSVSGFIHLVISTVRTLRLSTVTRADLSEAKLLATRLFLRSLPGEVVRDGPVILVKLLQAFDIKLPDVSRILRSRRPGEREESPGDARKLIGGYVSRLLVSGSCKTAVAVSRHFGLRDSGTDLLVELMKRRKFRLAKKWASFTGKRDICTVIRRCLDNEMFEYAFVAIRKHNVWVHFPDVHDDFRRWSITKLVENGRWDVAETKAKHRTHLLEYLVFLAKEAGYRDKADELCRNYSLEGFDTDHRTAYGDIVWVDDGDELRHATDYMERCRIIGIDCELGYREDSGLRQVSIAQIACGGKMYVIDLKKLCGDEPDAVNSLCHRVLHSPRILKLGYNISADLTQLSASYGGEMDCFRRYEMFVDVGHLFNGHKGGLFGLTRKILGISMNKVVRESDWMRRPLSQDQLMYAALDAAVLVPIFGHAPMNGGDRQWKSFIVTFWSAKDVRTDHRISDLSCEPHLDSLYSH